MKYILLFILFSLCVGVGLIIYYRFSLRNKIYIELYDFFYNLQNEINYKMISVIDYFYKNKTNYCTQTQSVIEHIIYNQNLNNYIIGRNDYEKLKNITTSLGYGDIDKTNNQLSYIIKYLEQCKINYKNTLNSKAKAYLKLSFCAGVLLIILLI